MNYSDIFNIILQGVVEQCNGTCLEAKTPPTVPQQVLVAPAPVDMNAPDCFAYRGGVKLSCKEAQVIDKQREIEDQQKAEAKIRKVETK